MAAAPAHEHELLLRGKSFYIADVQVSSIRQRIYQERITQNGGVVVREPSESETDYFLVEKKCEHRADWKAKVQQQWNECTGKKMLKSLHWLENMLDKKTWLDPEHDPPERHTFSLAERESYRVQPSASQEQAPAAPAGAGGAGRGGGGGGGGGGRGEEDAFPYERRLSDTESKGLRYVAIDFGDSDLLEAARARVPEFRHFLVMQWKGKCDSESQYFYGIRGPQYARELQSILEDSPDFRGKRLASKGGWLDRSSDEFKYRYPCLNMSLVHRVLHVQAIKEKFPYATACETATMLQTSPGRAESDTSPISSTAVQDASAQDLVRDAIINASPNGRSMIEREQNVLAVTGVQTGTNVPSDCLESIGSLQETPSTTCKTRKPGPNEKRDAGKARKLFDKNDASPGSSGGGRLPDQPRQQEVGEQSGNNDSDRQHGQKRGLGESESQKRKDTGNHGNAQIVDLTQPHDEGSDQRRSREETRLDQSSTSVTDTQSSTGTLSRNPTITASVTDAHASVQEQRQCDQWSSRSFQQAKNGQAGRSDRSDHPPSQRQAEESDGDEEPWEVWSRRRQQRRLGQHQTKNVEENLQGHLQTHHQEPEGQRPNAHGRHAASEWVNHQVEGSPPKKIKRTISLAERRKQLEEECKDDRTRRNGSP